MHTHVLYISTRGWQSHMHIYVLNGYLVPKMPFPLARLVVWREVRGLVSVSRITWHTGQVWLAVWLLKLQWLLPGDLTIFDLYRFNHDISLSPTLEKMGLTFISRQVPLRFWTPVLSHNSDARKTVNYLRPFPLQSHCSAFWSSEMHLTGRYFHKPTLVLLEVCKPVGQSPWLEQVNALWEPWGN